MADYSQVNDYSAKDALATGNPLKLIKGSDVDAEFSAISTAIASKFDSTDIASAAEAQAGTDNTKVITPARLTAWGQNDAGVIEDLQALADPNADRILFWDDSAGTTTWLTVGATLAITATTLDLQTGAGGGASADRILTAGNGLSGGGDLTADRTFDLDFNELTAVGIAAGDEMAFGDVSDTNTVKKITFANLEATLNHDSLAGFVANEHIDHTAVTITAGVGLSYSVGGTNIAADATIDLDVNELTAETSSADTDAIALYDDSAAAMRKMTLANLLGNSLGDGKWYRNAAFNFTSTKTTLVFDTADYNSLQRGTFSVAAGTYTVGASSARILVTAQVNITDFDEADDAEIYIQVNGVDKAIGQATNRGQFGASGDTLTVSTTLSLAASDVVRLQIFNDTTNTGGTGVARSFISIVELA
jgi:hypothetical protein